MLLDTKLGVIYFAGTRFFQPGPVCEPDAPFEAVRDDPAGYAPQEEAETWRTADGRVVSCAWAVEDFFEMLKYHFRELNYIPTFRRTVEENFESGSDPSETEDDYWYTARRKVAEVYREHGWPDLEVYQKNTCMEAVTKRIEELEAADSRVIFLIDTCFWYHGT